MIILFIVLIIFSIIMYIKSRDIKWHDVKHIGWLFTSGIKDLFRLDFNGVGESYYFIKMHLTHTNKKINK